MSEPTPLSGNGEAFMHRLDLLRTEPDVLSFDQELGAVALAVGLLIGGGFPYSAALCARAAELAWPDLNLPWRPRQLASDEQ